MTKEKSLCYFIRGGSGDIIYALPTISSLGKGKLFLRRTCDYERLKDLLELQPYIESVAIEPKKQHIDYNLDVFRKVHNKNKSIHLAQCSLYANKCHYDLKTQWLFNIPTKHVADIVINRTTRYHDIEKIKWNLLKDRNCAFIGTKEEHRIFCKKYFDLPYHNCKDGLEMASVIKGSQLFVGNQSFAFAIAEAMKHMRVLEVCSYIPDCMPQSRNGYTVLDKLVFRKLDK